MPPRCGTAVHGPSSTGGWRRQPVGLGSGCRRPVSPSRDRIASELVASAPTYRLVPPGASATPQAPPMPGATPQRACLAAVTMQPSAPSSWRRAPVPASRAKVATPAEADAAT